MAKFTKPCKNKAGFVRLLAEAWPRHPTLEESFKGRKDIIITSKKK